MAIWVEIHCDKKTAGADPCGAPLCYGMNGNQPGGMARIADAVPAVLRGLKSDALKSGWSFAHGIWTCPKCRDAKTT